MGKIYVVGLGPGNKENMTLKAVKALRESNVIIGYSKYIDLVLEESKDKEVISSPMKMETQRCELTVKKAEEGNVVSLISSGDSGIYGMAGILLQMAEKAETEVEIEIVPGVTAASAAAALLGAPLMHDFAVISLSDLLTPWEVIEKRLYAAAAADFVISIYNPKSKLRSGYLKTASEIILEYRHENTPVGIVRNAGRENESISVCRLCELGEQQVDMFSTVIVGNSQSYVKRGKMITPRGYKC